MIGIVVRDMKRTLDFYRALGLDIPPGAEGEGHVEVITPNGYRIAWDAEHEIKSFDPDWKEPTSAGRIGLAFKCDSPADVDATYRRLVDGGYHGRKEPWDAFWGQRYAQVEDPDGNVIDLFAPM